MTEGKSEPIRIGWQDEEYVYLYPEIAYKLVCTFCHNKGKPFQYSEEEVWADLKKNGQIDCDENSFYKTVAITGSPMKMIKIKRSLLDGCSGPIRGDQSGYNGRPQGRPPWP